MPLGWKTFILFRPTLPVSSPWEASHHPTPRVDSVERSYSCWPFMSIGKRPLSPEARYTGVFSFPVAKHRPQMRCSFFHGRNFYALTISQTLDARDSLAAFRDQARIHRRFRITVPYPQKALPNAQLRHPFSSDVEQGFVVLGSPFLW